MMRPLALAIVLASASFATVAAVDSPRQSPAPTQTVIDFIAIGKDGQPVLDLTSKEITLEVGGRQRALIFFQLLRAEGTAAVAPPPVPPPFATNAASAARSSTWR